jgi:peptide/nickel transport system ATP-binding protein
VLSVRSLSARHGRTKVTHDLDLSLAAGECLAIVGESGSGKTTLARAVCGLHPDYSGRVFLRGAQLSTEVTRRSRDQRRAVQYVFQNPWGSLNPRRRVGASVAVAAQYLRALRPPETSELAVQILLDVGVRADHADAMPQQLSGGQRQRVALARALAADPDVLVCDEVTSSLHVAVQVEIVAVLQRIQAEHGLSMLFITHDLGLAASIAHRVVVLNAGGDRRVGDTAQVLDAREPSTLAGWFGPSTPPGSDGQDHPRCGARGDVRRASGQPGGLVRLTGRTPLGSGDDHSDAHGAQPVELIPVGALVGDEDVDLRDVGHRGEGGPADL